MESLTELLAGELVELRRFCALLEEERKALTGVQADRLPAIAGEKSSLASQLSRFEAHRDDILSKSGFAKGRTGMEAWLANPPARLNERRQWNELLKLAGQARDANETNGRLINLLLKQNQDALAVLLSGGGVNSIYGADGQQRSLAAGKRSFGVV